MRYVLLTIAAATLLLIAMPPVSVAGPAQTGIEGEAFLYVSYGPPVEIEPGIWVDAGDVQLPVVTSVTIYSSNSAREVSRVATDANGKFSVALHPGKYVLVPDELKTFCSSLSVDPIEITVH